MLSRTNNEFEYIDQLIDKSDSLVTSNVIDNIEYEGERYPIHSFIIGPKKVEGKDTAVIGLFGGVHGLEKVGSHVVLAYLNYIIEQLKWNEELRSTFKKIRLVSIPIVNPVGLVHNFRSNGNGVDLMRNAPVEAQGKVFPLIGGHKKGSWLPWYRGRSDQMEKEAQVLCDFVKEEVLSSKTSMTIDFHSGFGIKDRLWFPYARSTQIFDEISKIEKLSALMDRTMPHHIYTVEPQSDNYTTHGDLWDYLYDYKKEVNPQGTFIPWTLEMGSWIWLKKNPMQAISAQGLFNPMKDHRFNRIMRRHFLMIDFFIKATRSHKSWSE